MIFIFLILLCTAPCMAMQTNSTSASHEVHISLELQRYGQIIATMKASLWHTQGVLVSYQFHKERYVQISDTAALDCHHNNIKKLIRHLCLECDNACKALSHYELDNLIAHTQNAQRLFKLLDHEATHFQKMVAKRFPHSKM